MWVQNYTKREDKI
jgi:hypothetical protein